MYTNNSNNNNCIVPIKGPRRGREIHIKQTILHLCMCDGVLCLNQSAVKKESASATAVVI